MQQVKRWITCFKIEAREFRVEAEVEAVGVENRRKPPASEDVLLLERIVAIEQEKGWSTDNDSWVQIGTAPISNN
jgi:hypothetical protein